MLAITKANLAARNTADGQRADIVSPRSTSSSSATRTLSSPATTPASHPSVSEGETVKEEPRAIEIPPDVLTDVALQSRVVTLIALSSLSN